VALLAGRDADPVTGITKARACAPSIFSRALSSKKAGGNKLEFTLRIENMHCGSCVRRVGQTLSSTAGIEVKEVRIGAARLSSNNDSAQVEAAVAALAKAGYPAQLEK
jgi:copper chaperone CopZ